MASQQQLSPADVQEFAERLIGDPVRNANLLPPLLSALQPGAAVGKHTVLAVRALELFFADLWQRFQAEQVAKGTPVPTTTDAPAAVHQQWIQRHKLTFLERLLNLLSSCDTQLQMSAVNALMDASRCNTAGGLFEPLLLRLLRQLLLLPAAEAGLSHFHAHFLKYPDVRYHALRAVSRICTALAQPSDAQQAVSIGRGAAASDTAARKHGGSRKRSRQAAGIDDHQQAADASPEAVYCIFNLLKAASARQADEPAAKSAQQLLLEALQSDQQNAAPHGEEADAQPWCSFPDRQDEDGFPEVAPAQTAAKWANKKGVRIAFSHAWLAFLRLPLPPALLHQALEMLHEQVLPGMSDPLLLSDFLTRAVSHTGAVAMLALHSLFLLMTKHGLEYPDFFQKLYSLMTPSIFRARRRARFFELADACLASGMVPAYTAAAFIKRFARLALSSTPTGAQVCIAMVHNLLRRHPSCLVLLDRPSAAPGSNALPMTDGISKDPFDNAEPDPAASQALKSSLWEVETLCNHYCPQVAAMVSLLEKDLKDKRKTAEITVGPHAAASYHSLITGMLAQRLKQAPVAVYAEPPVTLCSGTLPQTSLEWSRWC